MSWFAWQAKETGQTYHAIHKSVDGELVNQFVVLFVAVLELERPYLYPVLKGSWIIYSEFFSHPGDIITRTQRTLPEGADRIG